MTEILGRVIISNPGPGSNYDGNNYRPSFGHRKVDLAAEVRRALRRKIDKPLKPIFKPTTPRAILVELGRQAKRMAGKADLHLIEVISSAGIKRSPDWERETYAFWLGGFK